MGCNCGKKKPEIVLPVVTPTIVELPKEEIDWYNNIDTIEPIKPKELYGKIRETKTKLHRKSWQEEKRMWRL